MRKNLFLHKLFILVIFNTVPVALAGNMELNLQCSCGFIPEFGREGLTCSPVLKRFDGENFVSSKTFQYDLGGLNQCELVPAFRILQHLRALRLSPKSMRELRLATSPGSPTFICSGSRSFSFLYV